MASGGGLIAALPIAAGERHVSISSTCTANRRENSVACMGLTRPILGICRLVVLQVRVGDSLRMRRSCIAVQVYAALPRLRTAAGAEFRDSIFRSRLENPKVRLCTGSCVTRQDVRSRSSSLTAQCAVFSISFSFSGRLEPTCA